ncbi:endospore germination permease [Alkalihalophilus pseudofirmus]|uniref:GerAB/ArcD/ProY family transporter n=1 Tax=Alkalihalophilus pseudofirmus TaxID=79885 RepID=UPI00259B4679|nr:endospore germination permease [Alkalihalophilus pseudofirmus]WEG17969.1 endospore germination permease [Alkalihalophilus pseudofirmus]
MKGTLNVSFPKISIRQFTILVILFTIGNTIINAPSIIAKQSGKDAWISSIIALILGLLLVLFYSYLGNKLGETSIFDYIKLVFGKVIGVIISLLLCIYFFILSSILLRQLGDFLITHIIPETPLTAIFSLFLFIIVMAVRLGLETISRASEVFLPIVLLFIILFMIALTPEIELTQIQPILDEGIRPVLLASMTFLSIPYLQLVAFLTIIPNVDRKKKISTGFILGTLIGGIVLIIGTTLCLLVIGANQTDYYRYPYFYLAQKISIGDIIERLEVFISLLWFVTIFFKLSILFYATTIGISQTFNLKEYRPIVLPLALILLIIALNISPNINYFTHFHERYLLPYALSFGLLLPLLLLFVDKIKRVIKS